MVWSDDERAAHRKRIYAYEQTDTWRRRSQEFRASRRLQCCLACKKPGIEVAHHVTYERAFYGTEPDEDLRGLCHSCHNYLHSLTTSRGGAMSLREATAWVLSNTPRHVEPFVRYYRLPQPPPTSARPERRLAWLVPVLAVLLALIAIWYVVSVG
jgi:hypothetical protein